jgi:hypothetical protein
MASSNNQTPARRFEAAISARKDRKKIKKAWYRTQKEHWLGWLREYNGPGYYSRQTCE